MADLRIEGLTKHYGSTVAVHSLDLSVADHEFMTLLGPSGSGKTTALRMIAGYIEPTAGHVIVGGKQVQNLPPEKRDIGMVFQSYALFPHMTVAKNIAFGLERRKVAKDEIRRRVEEVLTLVRLEGLDARFPRQLSGGQQQRVALARALVIRPTLLLLDEPLSNLDAKLREEVRIEIRRLQRSLGITTILVTHDQEEALTVSDRIAVLKDGRLQQLATPNDLYARPSNKFVADFIGKMNMLPGTRVETQGAFSTYRLDGGIIVSAPGNAERVTLAVRPEAVRVGTPLPGANVLLGKVEYRAFLGELIEIGLSLPNGALFVVRGIELDGVAVDRGDDLTVWWTADKTTVLDPD